MGDVDLRRSETDVLTSVLTLELRVARLEAALARMIIRIDPTKSYTQAVETLRS